MLGSRWFQIEFYWLQAVYTGFCGATVEFGQNYVGLQSDSDRILLATIRFRQNFVRLESNSDKIFSGSGRGLDSKHDSVVCVRFG